MPCLAVTAWPAKHQRDTIAVDAPDLLSQSFVQAEADAQVAFLVKCGLAHAVITEDSDILVYMAAVRSTASVLYKMDEFGACKSLGFDPSKISSLPGVSIEGSDGDILE